VKTVLKIVLGMILGSVLLIVGCAAVIGGAVKEVQKESDKASITLDDYKSIEVGSSGATLDEVIARFGEPQSQDDTQTSTRIDGLPDAEFGMQCVYYNRTGALASLFQICFDTDSDRAESKMSV
jgi:hypothetical protein